ncbi:aldose 1-epimerase family protein [Janibacter cremeus]|uniref:Aldose 1-epimerase n=1 Tax=Janibacter cremeus TaxID=1285192 RepID=A0A852VT56_9MICO|nr:aldose 1-epimerase family protein [Janibacter cremeus]NYF97843.1 aldose 1-epimerase [Janibacter cremeus]
MALPPTGTQWQLTSGDVEAVVVEVGGGLRTLTVAGVDVVAGYPVGDMAPAGRGQLLVPWPNRIRDGRYRFDGREHELPITERSTDNASHGLVRWEAFRPTERDEDRVVLVHTLHPRPGYPFALEARVAWQVDPRGLTCATTITNVGHDAAPVGYGAHPYLALGSTPASQARLTVPADRVVLVDPDRKLPVGTHEVADSPFDLRGGEPLGDRDIDNAYTGLERGPDGCWTVTLEGGPAGRTTRLWGGPGLDWVQVFTGRSTPASLGEGLATGIAVEPLACPPDAFNSGEGVIDLQPGATWTGQWGIEIG